MEEDDFLSLDPNVDYRQILPIQQKRIIAFVNHFLMNTVSYLNKFAQSCESRFMEFEYKLEKVESSLHILESQLSSIPGLDIEKPESEKDESVIEIELPQVFQEDLTETTIENISEVIGLKAFEDPRYKKFFKMVQFGVPEPAVKLKMQNEGIDPAILNNPNVVLPGQSFDQNESDKIGDESSPN